MLNHVLSTKRTKVESEYKILDNEMIVKPSARSKFVVGSGVFCFLQNKPEYIRVSQWTEMSILVLVEWGWGPHAQWHED